MVAQTHIIKDGKIINTILATIEDAQATYPDCTCVDAASGGGIGDSWDGVAFTTPSKYATVEEAVIDKRIAITYLRNSKITRGFPYKFPDSNGTIQTRDLQDIINILGTTLAGLICEIHGDDDTILPFRDEEDEGHDLAPTEGVTMGLYAWTGYVAIYRAAWRHKNNLKDMIKNGATIAEIEAYDITTGWPE